MQALVTIRDTIRDGITAIWGDDGVSETGNRFEPHLSLAYVNTDGPADAALRALTGVKAEPVRITVNKASLIVLRPTEHLYRWETFAAAAFYIGS